MILISDLELAVRPAPTLSFQHVSTSWVGLVRKLSSSAAMLQVLSQLITTRDGQMRHWKAGARRSRRQRYKSQYCWSQVWGGGPQGRRRWGPREDKAATEVDNLAHRVDARQYARP